MEAPDSVHIFRTMAARVLWHHGRLIEEKILPPGREDRRWRVEFTYRFDRYVFSTTGVGTDPHTAADNADAQYWQRTPGPATLDEALKLNKEVMRELRARFPGGNSPFLFQPFLSPETREARGFLPQEAMALMKKHGTPAEFAESCYALVPGTISMREASKAIDDYNREWEEALGDLGDLKAKRKAAR